MRLQPDSATTPGRSKRNRPHETRTPPPDSDPVEFTDVLEPGLYGYACFVETDDDQTHASLGMIGTFTAA
jgi:hypothetical protein